MRVAYIGNFQPLHSTENDIASALANLDVSVGWIHEDLPDEWTSLIRTMGEFEWDFILWTSTHGFSEKIGHSIQWQMLAEARRHRIPVVGYHLDRWWGLERQSRIATEPFFRVDLLCTADGGHQMQWDDAGLDHHWMPPAIAGKNVGVGTFREEYASDIAFVGNWDGSYHREWKHRHELVHWLERTYDKRVAFWPKRGQHAVRGRDLNDLYASARVVVGDSCLVPKVDGSPMTHYCSDRIPETLGRGGTLIHPSVEGIDDLYQWHARWPVGDWKQLRRDIDALISIERAPGMRENQTEYIRMNHTYEVRMTQLFDELRKREMIA